MDEKVHKMLSLVIAPLTPAAAKILNPNLHLLPGRHTFTFKVPSHVLRLRRSARVRLVRNLLRSLFHVL